MSRHAQRGMTLVELLVGMAVTTIVLVGITGVLYGITSRYQQSIDRIGDASTGSALAAAIQADSHRYVICYTAAQELDLCLPNSTMNVVTYTINPNGPPYSITRTEIHGSNQSSTLVGRGLFGQPTFWRDCQPAAGTLSGHIHVRWLRGPSHGFESFSVYYRAPLPQSLPVGCG